MKTKWIEEAVRYLENLGASDVTARVLAYEAGRELAAIQQEQQEEAVPKRNVP